MATATQSALIDAPVERLRTTLLDAPRLPEWNPAFVRVTGPPLASRGARYELEVIRGLRGDLTYLLGGALHSLPALRLERLAEQAARSADRGRRQGGA
ncbi:hypothetical protein HQ32_03401 [Prauserella sp. Am3]|nr:hypothetical protein HQ32_03401 [Prauserella sp. Am3]